MLWALSVDYDININNITIRKNAHWITAIIEILYL
jgi:hypothetical protein